MITNLLTPYVYNIYSDGVKRHQNKVIAADFPV